MNTFKQNDFGFSLSTQLFEKIEDQAETVFDLTGKTAVVRIRYPNGNTVQRTPVVDDADQGQISFVVQAADTVLAGVYECTVVVTASGLKKTFPSYGYLGYKVEPSIEVP